MTLVAGVDSSTQSCKIVVCDASDGKIVRRGSAPHPSGTEVDPEAWWRAFVMAADMAGGLADVDAISIAAQQHGMVCLNDQGRVVRPAILWNDTRSSPDAHDLVIELGEGSREDGRRTWVDACGSVPVASLTISKLRWLADHEPEHADALAAVALPHDWLTWRLRGSHDLTDLVTDRSDASGTGYFDGTRYRYELLDLALRGRARSVRVPRVLGPQEAAGTADGLGLSAIVGPGAGDNASGALGLGLSVGQTLISVGTSGVVAAVSARPVRDPTGLVTCFADATGVWLPLACTLNASRVLDSVGRILGVDHEGLNALALVAQAGAGGLVLIPYFAGERTPDLPDATGSLLGVTLGNATRENFARAAVEGVLCLLTEAMNAVNNLGVEIEEVTLIGGGARSQAIRELAPMVMGVRVRIPPPGQYVALGAARQAAWVLEGGGEPPVWRIPDADLLVAEPQPHILARYRELRDSVT